MGSLLKTLKTLKRFPVRVVRVVSGFGRKGQLFRDVQDRIDELADVLQAGNGVEASAARVADEELGAIREDGYGMGAERHIHAHAEGGIVVAQRLLKFFEMGNRFPEQLRVKVPPRFHEALLRGIGVQVQHDFNAQAVAPAKLPIEVTAVRPGIGRVRLLFPPWPMRPETWPFPGARQPWPVASWSRR